MAAMRGGVHPDLAGMAQGAALDDDFEEGDEDEDEDEEDVGRGDTPPARDDVTPEMPDDGGDPSAVSAGLGRGRRAPLALGTTADDGDDEEDEDALAGDEDVNEDDDEDEEGTRVGKGYNRADYEHLSVGADVRELFEFIDLCKPVEVELEPRFKPFVPDFIPAVGDIDPFLKPPRPDGAPEMLGITALDEPAGKQSDPAVLEMLLRMQSKRANLPSMQIRGIEHAEHKPKEVLAWVDRIAQLHQTSPAATSVTYSAPMPPIERLMEEWPPEVEALLDKLCLPTADLDVDLHQFARIACALLDIPVHGTNEVEALHVLFSLYSAFKENEFFRGREALGISGTGVGTPTGDFLGATTSSSASLSNPR